MPERTHARVYEELTERLGRPDLTALQRYYALSAAVALGRSQRDAEGLDRLLDSVSQTDPEPGLALLAALWHADNALYTGRYPEAEKRYRDLLSRLRQDPLTALQPWLLLDHPLTDFILSQLETAIATQGRLRDAARLNQEMPAQSDPFRPQLQLRAQRQAMRAGDSVLSKEIQSRKSGEAPILRGPPAIVPPPVRSPESLNFRAPWQDGVSQRAGAFGKGIGLSLEAYFRHLTSAESRKGCGRYSGGFYYDVGSHTSSRFAGRDTFSIDFTAAPGRENPYGHGSFGVEIRATLEGVVGMVYYGTPTHHGVRSKGPLAENNRVQLYHVATEPLTFEHVMSRYVPRRHGRHLVRRPLAFTDLWDYQSQYYHLAGLKNPCGEEILGARKRPCVPNPAQVSPGQYVWQGTPLGFEDSTGYSWADHLHFQINQSCRSATARCTTRSQQDTGVSIPLTLEGRFLGARSLGMCVPSSNVISVQVDADRDGLPDVLADLLKTVAPVISSPETPSTPAAELSPAPPPVTVPHAVEPQSVPPQPVPTQSVSPQPVPPSRTSPSPLN